MKLDDYSFELRQERVEKWETVGKPKQVRQSSYLEVSYLSVVSERVDKWRGGWHKTRCGTYLHVPDETWMNNNQASYLVSVRLIFVFILASSVPCGEVRLQSNTDI